MMINSIAPSLIPETQQLGESLRAGGLSESSQTENTTRSFQATLTDAIEHVNEVQHESDDLLKGLASGRHVDLHGTMISLEKADISLRAMVSVRDKLVQAYEQVMNMTL